MPLEREGFILIARIKQVGDRTFEQIIMKKNIGIFKGAQGRILYNPVETGRMPELLRVLSGCPA